MICKFCHGSVVWVPPYHMARSVCEKCGRHDCQEPATTPCETCGTLIPERDVSGCDDCGADGMCETCRDSHECEEVARG